MHCVCSGLYSDVNCLDITDMCLAQTCSHNKTSEGYCKSSCLCWQCCCRHVSCCWTLSSSRKSFTCKGDSVIWWFPILEMNFFQSMAECRPKLVGNNIASGWSAEWCAGATQWGVLCTAPRVSEAVLDFKSYWTVRHCAVRSKLLSGLLQYNFSCRIL